MAGLYASPLPVSRTSRWSNRVLRLDGARFLVLRYRNIEQSREGPPVVKRLTKHGNSLALVIERGVLDLLDVNAETPLSVTTDGKCLIITPVREPQRDKRFRAALAEGNRRYGKMLKRLAD